MNKFTLVILLLCSKISFASEIVYSPSGLIVLNGDTYSTVLNETIKLAPVKNQVHINYVQTVVTKDGFELSRNMVTDCIAGKLALQEEKYKVWVKPDKGSTAETVIEYVCFYVKGKIDEKNYY